jgi:hypothetical protein
VTTHVIDSYAKLAALHWKRIAPGDVVEITGEIDASGHNGPVTFFCDGAEGSPVVIKGGGTIRGRGLQITGQHVVIDNIRLHGGTWGSLRLVGALKDLGPKITRNIHVKNCHLEDGGAAIWCEHVSHVLVEHCHIENLRMIVNDPAPDNDFGAIALKVTHSTNIEMRYCTVNDATADSQDYRTDGAALESFQNAAHVHVHHNLFYATVTPFEIGGYGGDDVQTDIVFEYNVVHIDPQYAGTPSARPVTIHADLKAGQYGVDIQAVRFSNNILLNYTQGSYISGKDALDTGQLVMENNVQRDEDITYEVFIERYGYVLAGVTKPEPVPPTVEPNPQPEPPKAWKNVTLRIQAWQDGKQITMPDSVATLLVPDAPISTEEEAFLDVFRRLGDADRAMLKTMAARLLA